MKHTGREKVDSRDMTAEETAAMTEVKYLMSFVNGGGETFGKAAQDEFVKEIVSSGVAFVMQARYILTAEESAILISALRKLTGRSLQ
jgi:hypothetical protein